MRLKDGRLWPGGLQSCSSALVGTAIQAYPHLPRSLPSSAKQCQGHQRPSAMQPQPGTLTHRREGACGVATGTTLDARRGSAVLGGCCNPGGAPAGAPPRAAGVPVQAGALLRAELPPLPPPPLPPPLPPPTPPPMPLYVPPPPPKPIARQPDPPPLTPVLAPTCTGIHPATRRGGARAGGGLQPAPPLAPVPVPAPAPTRAPEPAPAIAPATAPVPVSVLSRGRLAGL